MTPAAPRRFLRDRRGGAMVAFGLALPVLLVGVGAAIEYGNLALQRTRLQKAVDHAALTAARELALANAKDASVEGDARDRVREGMRSYAPPDTVAVRSAVFGQRRNVDVEAKLTVRGVMAKVMNWPSGDVVARATGRLIGQAQLCILSLAPSANDAVALEKTSQITASQCSVYSNSSAGAGVDVRDAALIDARSICSGGGFVGAPIVNYTRTPWTGCPALADPLAGRSAPSVGGCDFVNFQVQGPGTRTMQPGHYCGGIKVADGASVTMDPGIYVIENGQFDVDTGASIQGDYVGVYLKGDIARIAIGRDTTVSLSAPKSGPMSGLLFFEDRAAAAGREHFVRSTNARRLLGTIYLPRGNLRVETDKPVADQSAYTVIVAQQLVLKDRPNLVMNAMYAQSDVPVPEGLGDRGVAIGLAR